MIVTILSPTAMLKTSRFCILDLSIKTYIIEYIDIQIDTGQGKMKLISLHLINAKTAEPFRQNFIVVTHTTPGNNFPPQNNLFFFNPPRQQNHRRFSLLVFTVQKSIHGQIQNQKLRLLPERWERWDARPQRIRLQRRMYAIYIVFFFLTFMVLCNSKLLSFFAR